MEQSAAPTGADEDLFDFIVVGAGPAGSILVCMTAWFTIPLAPRADMHVALCRAAAVSPTRQQRVRCLAVGGTPPLEYFTITIIAVIDFYGYRQEDRCSTMSEVRSLVCCLITEFTRLTYLNCHAGGDYFGGPITRFDIPLLWHVGVDAHPDYIWQVCSHESALSPCVVISAVRDSTCPM